MFFRRKTEEGYTFVELVTMVMIFGTVSLFILPSFNKSIYRFNQKEALGIINSMIKAAKSSYALFAELPSEMGAVSKFAKIKKCIANNVEIEGSSACKGSKPVSVEDNDVSFYSPSGNYKVEMSLVYTLDGKLIYLAKANPNGKNFSSKGSAVVGCFNSFNGITEIKEYSAKSSDRGVKSFIKCSSNSVLVTKEEKERLEQERLEQERLEQERLEQERLEQERLEQERLEQERLEQERLEQERLEQERLERERLEQERLEQERLERERLERKPKKCLIRNPRRPSQCLSFEE